MPEKNNIAYIPSSAIRQRIAVMEGDAMNKSTIDPRSHRLTKKNNSFENEARLFYYNLPVDIRDEVLSNQALADNLFSYSYNAGSGNFKKRVVPALEAYYNGIGSKNAVLDSMYGLGDSELNGLSKRRVLERAMVRKELPVIYPKPNINYTAQPDATRVARPMFVMPVHKREEGGSLDTPKQWEDLSLSEKSDVMKAAVRNGVTSLADIRKAWDDFADSSYEGVTDGGENGGERKKVPLMFEEPAEHKFLQGRYKPSDSIKRQITWWKGDSMKTNRSFGDEARDFWNALPQNVRNNLSQGEADALNESINTSYNNAYCTLIKRRAVLGSP